MSSCREDIIENSTRDLLTSNLDELSKFQASKNRRYTQLQPGKVSAKYIEASLGPLQIFRETLNVGTRIEASPSSQLLPFAFISPKGSFRFCGQEHANSTFVQASGGIWDISFQGELDYIATAFSRDYFVSNCQQLLDGLVPEQFFESKILPTTQHVAKQYADNVYQLLHKLHSDPLIKKNSNLHALINAQVVKLTINALTPAKLNVSMKPQAKRIIGVKRVIEYLHVHAKELPDIQTLCFIAGLSERSLQYGFLEYIALTPIQYLRLVRLNGARCDLLAACQTERKVSDIALKWGFLEFGRFSKEYKQLFLELPSLTLRR